LLQICKKGQIAELLNLNLVAERLKR
jgi:hypothetical protein